MLCALCSNDGDGKGLKMVVILDLPIRTRLFIKRTPWLYRLTKHLTDRRAKHLLCDRATDLCIEGYQIE